MVADVKSDGYTNDIHQKGTIMSLVAKWGHSLAVRLPKSVQQKSRIKEGDEVNISVSDTGDIIIIKPISRKKQLEALLNAITPENIHGETDWGKTVGREVW
jgi:antitoxin MazE